MPLDWTKYQRRPSTPERFEELRPQKKQREIPQNWRDDLQALNDGGVLEYEAPDPRAADTLRRTLARYAASEYAMKLDYSGSGTIVVVKKSNEPYVKKERKKKQPVGA